jgi:hypothetical protein
LLHHTKQEEVDCLNSSNPADNVVLWDHKQRKEQEPTNANKNIEYASTQQHNMISFECQKETVK